MRICLFEDAGVNALEPLTLTRPAFDLWCGATTLLSRQKRYFAAREVGALIREELIGVCRLSHPRMPLNDLAWLRREPCLLVNARWLPGAELPADFRTPRVASCEGQVAYMVLPEPQLPLNGNGTHNGNAKPHISLSSLIEHYQQALPRVDAGGTMIDYPWDLVECNPQALSGDWSWRRSGHGYDLAPPLTVVGPTERVLVHPTATVEPFVVADATRGPIFIEKDATIQAFTRLEGPCYIGEGTVVARGTSIRASTIGPVSRVGGEIEASIIHGYSNKCHDGFLGHSYVGEWVNFGAGTQVSDLRNDYEAITVTLNGERVNTGLTKVGAFFGDHTKTGLDTLINSGSVIGAFCQLLPTGGLLPRCIPSFCRIWHGHIKEHDDFLQLLRTAAVVVERRGKEWSDALSEFVIALYDRTAGQRRQTITPKDVTHLRKSLV